MFEALNALRFIDMIHSRVSHGDFVDPVPSFPHHGPQVVALTAAAALSHFTDAASAPSSADGSDSLRLLATTHGCVSDVMSCLARLNDPKRIPSLEL